MQAGAGKDSLFITNKNAIYKKIREVVTTQRRKWNTNKGTKKVSRSRPNDEQTQILIIK